MSHVGSQACHILGRAVKPLRKLTGDALTAAMQMTELTTALEGKEGGRETGKDGER